MSRGPHLRQQAERRVQQQRAAEERQSSLSRYLLEQNAAGVRAQSDLHVESLRRQRQRAAERQELFVDDSYIQAEQDKARKAQVADIESRVAAEVAKQKAAEAREAERIRRVCEGSEELRVLKEKLHAASVNQGRAVQLLERQVREQEEVQREERILSHLEARRVEEEDLQQRGEREKMRQRADVKSTQQEQMGLKEKQKHDWKQEHLRDKAQVDELVVQVAAEDAREEAAKGMRKEQTRQMLQQHLHEREAYKRATQEREAIENFANEEYARGKREFEAKLAHDRERQAAEKQHVLDSMVFKMEGQLREADERQRIRDQLHYEESLDADRRRSELEIRKKLDVRRGMAQTREEQLRALEERKRLEYDEEQRLREQLMAKFAEDDRIEQMSAQRRRMKVQEHKREVETQVQARRKKFEAERQLERDEIKRTQEDEETRRQVIENERRRLLVEHAGPLKGFLPKGVLALESDLQLVGTSGDAADDPPPRAARPAWTSPLGARGSSCGPDCRTRGLW